MRIPILKSAVASIIGILGVPACGGDTNPQGTDATTDTASNDLAGEDIGTPDSSPGDDTTTPEDVTTMPDGTTTSDITRPVDIANDDVAPDITTDDVAVDPGFVPDPNCEYLDMTRFVVKCDGILTYGGEYLHIGDPNEACIPYVGIGQGTYLTLDAAIAGENCDGTCVNRAGRSVSAVYCRGDCATLQRYGWIEYAADGCATLYELPGGLFLSVADWFMGQTDVCASGTTACLAVPIDPEIPAER